MPQFLCLDYMLLLIRKEYIHFILLSSCVENGPSKINMAKNTSSNEADQLRQDASCHSWSALFGETLLVVLQEPDELQQAMCSFCPGSPCILCPCLIAGTHTGSLANPCLMQRHNLAEVGAAWGIFGTPWLHVRTCTNLCFHLASLSGFTKSVWYKDTACCVAANLRKNACFAAFLFQLHSFPIISWASWYSVETWQGIVWLKGLVSDSEEL